VTVIDQHLLPPMWWKTPHITMPAHRRGHKPPWQMDTNVSNTKVTFEVTKGHP